MRTLVLISVDGLLSPKFTIELETVEGGEASFGWGIGWYPLNQTAAVVHKEPAVRAKKVLLKDLIHDSKFRSNYFLFKLKEGVSGYTHHETQPFSRSFGGNEWIFVHNGKLDYEGLENRFDNKSLFLEPLGKTDSELAFCYLLSKFHEANAGSLKSITPEVMRTWFSTLDTFGGADIAVTDGTSSVCYHGLNSEEKMYYLRITPVMNDTVLQSDHITIDFQDPRDSYRTKLVVSSQKLSGGDWVEMVPGQLIFVSQGDIVWNSHEEMQSNVSQPYRPQAEQTVRLKIDDYSCVQTEQPQVNKSIMNTRSITKKIDGSELSFRVFDICHKTEYSYTEPVQHSTHSFRLHPQENAIQEVDYSTLTISSPGEKMHYEDVFGNQTLHYSIHEPYSNLVVESCSRVKVYGMPEDDVSLTKRQTTIPLVWMPWQRQMMIPYLLPQELPDTELEELISYAMSFVDRNDFHLLDTIKDINMTIYRDYSYIQGETFVNTTPFEVYVKRVGVCQDFTNLLICLARLLGIPARYQMGYIYTGASYENKIQSEASHAWAELYLPYIGWRGFDPTNGCLVGQNHIRVARGRNYRDATPTSGTLYRGGGNESLSVTVRVEEV